MRYNIVLVFLVFSCSAVEKDCLELSYVNGLTYRGDELFSGQCVTRFPNDSIRSIQNYLNGKDNGEWIFYFENGNIETTGKFVEGKRVGYWNYYYPNGVIKQKSFYNYGIKDSIWEYYNDKGKLVMFDEF